MSAVLPRQTYPAFLASCAVALGIFLGSLLAPSTNAHWFVVAAIAAASSLLAFLLIAKRPGWGLLPYGLALLLGAGRVLVNEPVVSLPLGQPVEIAGEVAAPPSATGSTIRCLLRTVRVTAGGDVWTVNGAVLTTIRQHRNDHRALRYGDVVTAVATLARPPVRRNPGEFNLRRFYESQGIDALAQVRDSRTLEVRARDRGSRFMAAVVFPFKENVLSIIDSTVGGAEGEFLKGLLLGERGGLPVALKEAFVVSGVAHVLAVSGSNVAVVAGALFLLLAVVRCPRVLRPWVLSAGLLFYMVLTGNQPPVVRATIMALVFLWSKTRQDRSDPYNVIGLSALIILAIDPRQLFDVGFQLSFVAVLSLVHIYPMLKTAYVALEGGAWYRRLTVGVLDLVALTLAATLGTLPITAAVFGRVSVIGLAANVVVVPASGLAVLLGMVAVASAFVSAWLGAVYGGVLKLLLHWTLVVVDAAGNVPFAAIDAYGFAGSDAIPFYAALLLWVHCRHAPVARRLAVVLAGALALWSFIPREIVPAAGGSAVRCTVLDVGQGDAILCQFPDGETLLVDTGPAGLSGDAGKNVIVPYLSRLGVARIDLLVVTHGHDDHVGGLRSLLRVFPIGKLLLPGDGAVHGLPSTVRARTGIVSSGDSLNIGGGRLYVLSPLRGDSVASGGGMNESSVVLKLVYGRSAVLLTGDEPATLEHVLVEEYGDFLKADLLKLGHHGSGTATSAEFLDVVRPRYAAVSVGRFNRHGHPSAEVLQRLEDRGILFGRTDDDGALMYEVGADTLVPVVWQ